MVVVGTDAHKYSHTFVATDEVGRQLGEKTVKATTAGHATAIMWAREQFGLELIKPGKPWRSIEDVELATARWVDWFNHRRLYQYCGDVPPVELEAAYYAQRQRPAAG
ncbi:putative transposase for insertion sequence element IS986/IS6110 [Mycobacterium tuberculosis]|nr:putative transposase for insertion sequence element IS986/IS6110 [Mycobacterium tuberculosis]